MPRKKRSREPLDAGRYVHAPALDVRGTVALAIKLLGLVPVSRDERDAESVGRIRVVARELREATLALQQAWAAREKQSSPKLRPLDIDFDNAWSAVLGRLEPWISLTDDPEAAEDAARASELIEVLFPNRLDFTRLELHAQWTEGERRMELIRDGLRPALVRLAGEPFVWRLERAHAALGRALGLDGRPADPEAQPSVDVLARIRDAQQSISEYALELVSVYRSASEELADKVAAALAPIDEFRAAARPSGADSKPVDPATPLPQVADD